MRKVVHRSVPYPLTVLSIFVLTGLLLTGCGEQPPLMDTATVSSPVDRPGVCEHCQKKLEKVTEEHLIIVRGNQYIICDEKCEADLKDWLAKQ